MEIISSEEKLMCAIEGIDPIEYHNQKVFESSKYNRCQNNISNQDQDKNNERLKNEINNVLDSLSDKELNILRLRFGLADGQAKTFDEVGQLLGVSPSQVRQIEAKALKKLKSGSKSIPSSLTKEFDEEPHDIDDDYLMVDEEERISNALINGIGNTKSKRILNNEVQIKEYTYFIYVLLDYLFGEYGRATESYKEFLKYSFLDQFTDKEIETVIKIANELPVEKLQESDMNLYQKIINTSYGFMDNSDRCLKIMKKKKGETPTYLKHIIDNCSVMVSLGDFFYNSKNIFRGKKYKHGIPESEEVDNCLNQLNITLEKLGLRLLNNNVDEIIQQLVFLLSLKCDDEGNLAYEIEDIKEFLNSKRPKEIVGNYIEEGWDVYDLYNYFLYQFEEYHYLHISNKWHNKYIGATVKRFELGGRRVNCKRVKLHLFKKEYKDLYYRIKNDIMQGDIKIDFDVEIEMQDNQIQSIENTYDITYDKEMDKFVDNLDYESLWGDGEVELAQSIVDTFINDWKEEKHVLHRIH